MSKTSNGFFRLIKAALLIAAIALTPFVYATTDHGGDKEKPEELAVNMAAITDAEILVDVKILNVEAKRLTLIIESDRGDELYRKELDKTSFHSRIRFPKENNIREYTIKLKSGSKSLEQFKIKSTSRVVEDVTISKL